MTDRRNIVALLHQSREITGQKSSDVKSSRPKWPRGQNFGIGLEDLALASNIWPQPGLDLVVLLCNWTFFGQKSCKIRELC